MSPILSKRKAAAVIVAVLLLEENETPRKRRKWSKKWLQQRHQYSHMNLLRELHNGLIQKFLRRDPCGVLADKYHLVIVFQYFMRADFKEEDYTTRNFFLALSLSHDIYDELSLTKRAIMKYCLAKENDITKDAKKKYQWDKLKLYKKMNYNGFMKKKICHNLFTLIPHTSIMRGRKQVHVGTFPIKPKAICIKCNMPKQEEELSKDKRLTESITKEEENCSKAQSRSRSVSESSNTEWERIMTSSNKSTKSGNVSECSSMDLDPHEWFG